MTTKLYSYNSSTKEYAGETKTTALSNGIISTPSFTTEITPPTLKANEVALWNGEDWAVKSDYRQETWFDKDGNQIEIDFIGDPKEQGLLTEPPEQPKPDLSVIQQSFKQRVDQDAEIERLKYITPGVGQSMTYQEKVNQATAYSKAYAAHLADPKNISKPNDAEYLLLASGLGIDGDTLIEAAETVTLAYAQWQYVGAAIEGIRLQAKLAIDEAKTIEAAQAVYDAIQWP